MELTEAKLKSLLAQALNPLQTQIYQLLERQETLEGKLEAFITAIKEELEKDGGTEFEQTLKEFTDTMKALNLQLAQEQESQGVLIEAMSLLTDRLGQTN